MFKSTLSQNAQNALAILGKSSLVKDGYLAGGSALALYFGHRYSIDFDFFTSVPFDPRKLSQSLKHLGDFKETLAKGISVIGTFNKVKLSYFHYQYPLLKPTKEFLGVSIAHPHDIAAMKLTAIMDRGTKRDFIDLYTLIQQGVSLEQIFSFYEKKYGKLEENRFSLIKALGYFDDAENTDMPQMIKEVSWGKVKDFFLSETLRLAKEYLGTEVEKG